MRSSSLNLLKQAEKNPEKVLKKLNELEEKVKESPKDVISINDPDARLMMNKKKQMGMGLQRTNHRGRIQRNNPIFIHYTKSNRPFRADSINRTIKKQFNQNL